MTELTVTTNNVPRDVVEAHELTTAEREQFDYLDWDAIEAGNDSASFFRFKGETFDLGEFMHADWCDPVWDGYLSDTFFSGMLVRYVEGFERVVVARYYVSS